MFGFSLESLKLHCSNPMLWAGLVLMVVAIIGYFWMTSKQEDSPKHMPSVSFAPTAQVMEIPANGQHEQMYQEQPEPQMFNNLEEQPTAATCIVNEAGEQVCA